ncbi:MAG: S8 family peptidase [Anaerolineales bacterium]
MRQRLEAAWEEAEQRQSVAHIERHGAYFDFISEPGFDLVIKSLEAQLSGIRLLNVRREGEGEQEQTFATVYVPHSKRGHFLRKIKAYSDEETRSDKPKNAKLVNSISDIRRSVLESFWQDDRNLIPSDTPSWVEVWLSSDKDEIIERFDALMQQHQIEIAEGFIKFPERVVKMILATRAQMEQLIELSDDIAEFRLGKEVASFFIELENREQFERVRELLGRTEIDENTDVVVCILDSGVNNGHLLIQPVLHNADLHTADPGWGTNDNDGHGTLVAGTVAYGDLLNVLTSGNRIKITHRLESAKILPPPPAQNPQKLWGHITAQGLYRAEIQGPDRKRIACLAVTSKDFRDRGRPSSWSGTLDDLTSGSADDHKRLIIVSAGNIEEPDSWRGYYNDNLTNEVHDPGQAWNVLTIGAFTEKVSIENPTLADYEPIAPLGGLSPYSTTSNTWPVHKWPIKPEVLFEGGNVARGPNDSIFDTEDLKLISTSHNPIVAQFAPFCATSAAAAQASWMAARIQALYPTAWPETIRALIVHTAQWTDTMRTQFLRNQSKAEYARLLRICGYGVPNLERALYCATNSLTLISQAELQPYDRRDRQYISHEMHLYNLPWPSDVLLELGETQVEMRVTLSYFVEPGPGEVGWQDRYRYPSHALRFAINGSGESEEEFVQRVNRQARDNDEHPGTQGPRDKWVIGKNTRDVGSIHSDIWQGTAAELSQSNRIVVYPAVGWWRERHHLERWNKRCRYSLVVSIQTPAEHIDIYTPVAVQVGIAVPVAIRTI